MPEFLAGDPVRILNSGNDAVIRMSAGVQSGGVIVPIGWKGAHLAMSDNDNSERILLNGSECKLSMFAKKKPGQVRGDYVMRLDAAHGDLFLGGGDTEGDVVLFPVGASNQNAGEATIHLNAGAKLFVMRGANGQQSVRIDGEKGEIELRFFTTSENVVMRLSGGVFPKFEMMNNKGEETVSLNAAFASLTLGKEGQDGTIIIKDQSGNPRIYLLGNQGGILLKDNADKGRLTLLGSSGDIIIDNADCAEDFDITGAAEPGTVMIIADGSRLRESTEPYDKRVAGVISGADDTRPGIVLGRSEVVRGRSPVALIGKVYCKTDAAYGSIEVGDLLTTSPVPGHAMKVSEPGKAFGAVLGKALRPLWRGRELIPILVALQ